MMILQGKKHSYLVFGRRVVRHALNISVFFTYPQMLSEVET